MLQIAKVLKSNGTDGGLLLGFRDILPDDIDLKEPVFIEFDGLPVPFFFEDFAKKGYDKAIVHLTGIHNLADAEEIAGRSVWAEIEDGQEDDSIEGLIGWKVFDQGKFIGVISGVEDIPGNPCFYIGESMIPLHEDLIEAMDEANQELYMNLPEGLI